MVGTGIQYGAQTTPQAQAAVETAEEVWYLTGSAAADGWIQSLNPAANSLASMYDAMAGDGADRRAIYAAIADTVIDRVVSGHHVCLVFYGHPLVFAEPTSLVSDALTHRGIPVRILPAISALDCLLADVGFDMGRHGLQSYSATDFLNRQPAIDFDARFAHPCCLLLRHAANCTVLFVIRFVFN